MVLVGACGELVEPVGWLEEEREEVWVPEEEWLEELFCHEDELEDWVGVLPPPPPPPPPPPVLPMEEAREELEEDTNEEDDEDDRTMP